jgi:3-methyladenine DNA glycosylase AlkD
MSPAHTPSATVEDVLAELESLGDEKRRRHNAKVGPDGIAGAPPDRQFGVKTGDIRKLAKRLKTDHELAMGLWRTGNLDAQLLAILVMKPGELSAKQIDAMVREARFSWVAEWLQAYIIKGLDPAEKEKLREKWMKKGEKDSWAARAGWHLTASKVSNGEGGVDVEALLGRIEKEMPGAPPETQWTMNNTLGAIGIRHATHRQRAIAIGEKVGLYKDWPVSKGCTIPYVPVWVDAMVNKSG